MEHTHADSWIGSCGSLEVTFWGRKLSMLDFYVDVERIIAQVLYALSTFITYIIVNTFFPDLFPDT